VTTLSARLVGGPTAVLEYGGQRWLTDPTLSPPGDYAGGLVKTTGPAFVPDDPDVVLLSHDHHADNLDPGGRELLPQAGVVLTTVAGAERLGGNAVGLEPWSSAAVGDVTVTAVPALHGPPGSEPVTGPVIGFVLGGEGLETVYVSGDNASLDVVRAIAERAGPIDVAVLFAGAVSLPWRLPHAVQRTGRAGGGDPRRARRGARALRGLDPLHPGRRGPARRVHRLRHRRPAGASRTRRDGRRLAHSRRHWRCPRVRRA
jgi:L-ascorbate metabolism protein UlaG (beta-lactamase superfamily)